MFKSLCIQKLSICFILLKNLFLVFREHGGILFWSLKHPKKLVVVWGENIDIVDWSPNECDSNLIQCEVSDQTETQLSNIEKEENEGSISWECRVCLYSFQISTHSQKIWTQDLLRLSRSIPVCHAESFVSGKII